MNQPVKATTVTIIGAGLGGIALVANLGLLGYRLRLHDRDEARIARVRERGGLDVEGLAKGFAPLELVTPQLAPAVDGADVIVVVTGSHFHADVARSLAGVLRDGQSILLIQGGTGGSLLVRRELRAAGCRAAVDVSEMDNYPYSLGWPEPTRVKLTIVKRFLQVASLPASRVERVLGPLRAAFPQVVAAPSILTTVPCTWRTWWATSAASRAAATRIGFMPRGTRRASSRCWKRSMPSGWPWPGLTARRSPASTSGC